VLIPILVWVGLTRKVIVATEPTGFWSVIWVGEPDLAGRLQAERTTTSERHIIGSLNVFNFAFAIIMKLPLTGIKEDQNYDRDQSDQPGGK
jgi:hypothetical protein